VLYLVPTPLGNLQDMTLRAIETLKSVDLIICEDTRHSKTLLEHYAIYKPLKSLHKFNEQAQLAPILTLLQTGQKIALISDAGTPCIQDPGALLVKSCHEHKIPVCALPGPCAFATALSLSGEEEGPFQFVGFLPKKEQAAKKALLALLAYEGHSCAYVSPHQLLSILKILSTLEASRPLFLVRELSKYYEESYQGPVNELYTHFAQNPPKGEFVMMIKKSTLQHHFDHLPIQEHIALLESTYQLSKNEAIKLAAKQRGVPKREIYNFFHKDPS
jgi:16S rRNA (cytidine1402-2'-O)-methyltransferase